MMEQASSDACTPDGLCDRWATPSTSSPTLLIDPTKLARTLSQERTFSLWCWIVGTHAFCSGQRNCLLFQAVYWIKVPERVQNSRAVSASVWDIQIHSSPWEIVSWRSELMSFSTTVSHYMPSNVLGCFFKDTYKHPHLLFTWSFFMFYFPTIYFYPYIKGIDILYSCFIEE